MIMRIPAILTAAVLAWSWGMAPQDIFDAVRRNDPVRVTAFVEENPAAVRALDDNGRSPLQVAVLYGFAGVVDALVRGGADPNTRDRFGRTPLQDALRGDEPVIAERLLGAGATFVVDGDDGRRTLHLAAWAGCSALVSRMADAGADLRSKNDNGGTLLHSAVRGRLTGWMTRLLGRGFDIDAADRYGLTPLHLAAMRGFDDGIRLLLGAGARIDAATPGGKTAYHAAVDEGQASSAALLLSRGASQDPPKFPLLRGDYLGQKPPGAVAEVFAPGIVSTMDWEHGGPVFSPDGNEMYWSPVAYAGSRGRILTSRRVDGAWTAPVPAPFTRPEYREMGPGLSADGRRIYFTSYRPVDPARKDVRTYNLWTAERAGDGWSEPRPLPPPVNVGGTARSTLARGDVLYFGSFRRGTGVVGRSVRRGGAEWSEPEVLPFNDRHAQICSYIDPEDRFLVFESNRPGGFGGFDLYVAFHAKDGSWGPAVNLGDRVNSAGNDWFASMSSDGRCFFFTSDRGGNDDVYWIDAGAVEALRPASGGDGGRQPARGSR